MRLTSEPVLHDALAAEKYCEGGNDRIPQKSFSTEYYVRTWINDSVSHCWWNATERPGPGSNSSKYDAVTSSRVQLVRVISSELIRLSY